MKYKAEIHATGIYEPQSPYVYEDVDKVVAAPDFVRVHKDGFVIAEYPSASVSRVIADSLQIQPV